MVDYFVDYETKSGLDLKKVGRARYLHDKDADIVFMTWTTYDRYLANESALLWLPGMPPPFSFTPSDSFYAFNAAFDRDVQEILGAKYDLPFVPLHQCVDLMAMCARYGYPQNLAGACQVLNLKQQKETAIGKRLMSKICSPPYTYTRQEFLQFMHYGLGDTNALPELRDALPADRLSASEQENWLRTQRMNQRGVEIDIRMASQVDRCIAAYKNKRNRDLQALTANEIKTAGQVAKLREWVEERGVTLHDLRSDTVRDTLLIPDLDPEIAMALQIRQDVSATSVQKFNKVLSLAYKRILHDLLVYHAASTGRLSSRGLQIHNLLRKAAENVDAVIESFFNGSVFSKNVVDEAKLIIRSMLRARADCTFVISDFGSIEYVFLIWLADDYEHMKLFADGVDPYKRLATRLFKKKYEDITKQERQVAKPGVLGGGYALSGDGYVEYAKGYGVAVDSTEGKYVIDTFREEYYLVKKLWYKLNDLIVTAVRNPGRTFSHKRVKAVVKNDRTGIPWLLIILPSGRALYYHTPKVIDGRFGFNVSHKGVDSKTRKWTTKYLTVPRLIENIDQATARDLLMDREKAINDAICGQGCESILSCHDEVVVEVPEAVSESMRDSIHTIMSTPPDWCSDLPLKAETFISKRYTKG